MTLPDIPRSWIIAILCISLVVLRSLGIDSWTTAGLGILIGYITGQHMEQSKNEAVTTAELKCGDRGK